jgi:hypothetical protein
MARRDPGSGTVTFEHTKGTACKEPRYHRRCTGRWRGMLDTGRNEAGKRSYRKVSGSTRQEIIDKLDAAKIEMAKGIRPKAGYTVARTVRDWLDSGLPGRAAKTVSTYREVTEPLLEIIGGKRLTELTAEQLRAGLVRIAKTRSTRTVTIAHRCLVRAITHAESRDLVGRNVAKLISPPQGNAPGRTSKSLTVLQARHLVHSAKESRLHAYIVLCLTTGIRTEEARALRWSDDPATAAISDQVQARALRSGLVRRDLHTWNINAALARPGTGEPVADLFLPRCTVCGSSEHVQAVPDYHGTGRH